jgi:hypothetical protein
VDVMGSCQVRCVWYMEVLFLSVKRTDQLCFHVLNRAAEGVLTTRLTEVGGVMFSWSAGRASPARGGVEGMLLVKSRYQHQQTRAAAAREGCRSMDGRVNNRRPGVRGWERRGGWIRGRGGT